MGSSRWPRLEVTDRAMKAFARRELGIVMVIALWLLELNF